MNQREILGYVHEHCPETMAKIATAVQVLEKLDPDGVPDLMEDFKTILGVVTEKTASADLKNTAKMVAIGVAASSAAGLANSVATDLYDAAKKKLTKGSNFRRIMIANPDLKNEDPKRLRSSFDTLHRYGPEFTADPLMGGSLLKAMSGLEGLEFTVIKDVINSRKNLLDSKARQFSPGHAHLEKDHNPLALEKVKHENKMKEHYFQSTLKR